MCAALPGSQAAGEGLLLDFPRARLASRGERPPPRRSPSPPSRAAAAEFPARYEEREQARTLLRESVDRAWQRLDAHPAREAADAEERLRHTLSAARQLLAKPGTRVEDLLNYLADVEAGAQLLLAAPAEASPAEAAGARGGARAQAEAAAPQVQAAGPGGGGSSSSSSPARPPGAPWASAPPEASLGAASQARAAGASGPRQGPGAAQLQLWDDALASRDEAERLGRLRDIGNEALTLVDLQRQVLDLAAAQGSAMDSTEAQVEASAADTCQAGRELGAAAKTKASGWTVKGSLGGAAVGAAVGACVAGPLGAALGAGVTAAAGGTLGKAAKRAHNSQVDRALANLEQPGRQRL